MKVTRIGDGLYRVTDNEKAWTVGIAGPPDNRWVWVDGQVAHFTSPAARAPARRRASSHDLSSPMPATVVRVMVEPGAPVTRGETLIMLEAMKMELPIRAPRDGVVKAVHCKQGELVQPGVNLIDVE